MAKKDRAKAEQRRAAREGRREAERRRAARHRRRRTMTWTLVGVVIIAALAALAWSGALGPQAAAVLGRTIVPSAGDRIPILGRDHIPQGTPYRGYTSNPPTSGPHWGNPADWGVYTQPIPDEALVHNLEHSGVWISYKDPSDAALAEMLAAIVQRYPRKVILTPRPQNDAPIALAAWGRLLKLQQFDEAKIVAFIDAHRGRAGPPEERGTP